MIPELGHFALIIALFVALVQSVFPMIGAAKKNCAWMGLAVPASILQFVLLAGSLAALIWCYVVSDFSVLNVVQNSHTDKPMIYKIAGVWGNHEGSMLLWVFILAAYGMAVSLFGGALPPSLRARALAVQGMISFGFLLFILLTSNPFLRIAPAPVNGEGLNPILQDPGLAFHPPFLYAGYVGFSMAFSFAIAALIEGRVDAAWARWVRPWTLLAWSFLTFGIAMGSWWAYYTLGWGGWWYWDPVENASFMPWLAGTALLHSSLVVERRDTLKAWTILLTIIAFSFSLLGTFLVRSGVLTSVHSFASDPSRGVFILGLLVVVIGGAMLLFAIRAPSLKAGGIFAFASRETSLMINNVLMASAAGAILLGTLYPLFADVLNLGKVSVGPPFFNDVFIPMMVPMIIVMAAAPLLSWKRAGLKTVFRKLKIAVNAAILVFVTALALYQPFLASGFLALATWLLVGTMTAFIERLYTPSPTFSEFIRRALVVPRAFYGMTMAHAGVAIIIIGIVGSTNWKTEKIQIMHPGDTVAVAGYDVTLKNVEPNVKGPNYLADRATFSVAKNGQEITQLHPEHRMYQVPPRPTTNAAIHATLLGDVYTVLGDPDGGGGYITRLYFNPLVTWIFVGASIVALGGFMSLTDRRYRLGIALPKRDVV